MYMTWEQEKIENIAKGKKLGISLINELYNKLLEQNRTADLKKAISDEEYMYKLMRELMPEKL